MIHPWTLRLSFDDSHQSSSTAPRVREARRSALSVVSDRGVAPAVVAVMATSDGTEGVEIVIAIVPVRESE